VYIYFTIFSRNTESCSAYCRLGNNELDLHYSLHEPHRQCEISVGKVKFVSEGNQNQICRACTSFNITNELNNHLILVIILKFITLIIASDLNIYSIRS
jgi:hypothetical protein